MHSGDEAAHTMLPCLPWKYPESANYVGRSVTVSLLSQRLSWKTRGLMSTSSCLVHVTERSQFQRLKSLRWHKEHSTQTTEPVGLPGAKKGSSFPTEYVGFSVSVYTSNYGKTKYLLHNSYFQLTAHTPKNYSRTLWIWGDSSNSLKIKRHQYPFIFVLEVL